jgi:hypothetical protein
MPKPGNFNTCHWHGVQQTRTKTYICGYCGSKVSSERGLPIVSQNGAHFAGCFICPNCQAATYFPPGGGLEQIPGSTFGNDVAHVPAELHTLYCETRDCVSNGNYTASVLLCRKMLMNIAVQQGAEHNLAFIKYVDYLSDKGFVPPHGKQWVDHIRKKGNEANHEITLMSEKDAKELVIFVEMLLKFIYEFPNLIPKEPTAASNPSN